MSRSFYKVDLEATLRDISADITKHVHALFSRLLFLLLNLHLEQKAAKVKVPDPAARDNMHLVRNYLASGQKGGAEATLTHYRAKNTSHNRLLQRSGVSRVDSCGFSDEC